MLYGAYGANLNMRSMEVRCPKAKPILGFNLIGYRLVFNGVADIVKDKSAKVPIGLWKITKECEKSLDRFEGYPYLYKKMRLKIDVPGFKGQKVMLYYMRRKGIGVPSDAYYSSIHDGYKDFALDNKFLSRAAEEAYMYQDLNINLARKVGS